MPPFSYAMTRNDQWSKEGGEEGKKTNSNCHEFKWGHYRKEEEVRDKKGNGSLKNIIFRRSSRIVTKLHFLPPS